MLTICRGMCQANARFQLAVESGDPETQGGRSPDRPAVTGISPGTGQLY